MKERFKHIFDTHYAGMIDFALWYLNDRSTAEDVVQQVFTSVWEKRDKLLQSENIQFYLFRSVKNRSLNYLREEVTCHSVIHSRINHGFPCMRELNIVSVLRSQERVSFLERQFIQLEFKWV